MNLSERYAGGEIDRPGFLDGIVGLLGTSRRARPSDVKGTLTGFLSRRRIINPFGGPAYHAAGLRPDQAAEAAALACRVELVHFRPPSKRDEAASRLWERLTCSGSAVRERR